MSFGNRTRLFLRRPIIWAGAVALAAGIAAASVTSAQTTALDRLMRQKLDHAQALLAAVVTSNWGELQQHSAAMIAVTDNPAWNVLKTPEYASQSRAFIQAAQELADAAKRRDLEEAPVAYISLTIKCVECHRYVARSRIAGAPPVSTRPR